MKRVANFQVFGAVALLSLVLFVYSQALWDLRNNLAALVKARISNRPTTEDKMPIDLPTAADLIAGVFHDQEDSNERIDKIMNESLAGQRDQYFIPKTYRTRLNNQHFNDIGFGEAWQKEVYLLARLIMKKSQRKGKVVDVGCGSGFKLVKYLSKDFETVGIETEPALSHLRKTYPDQVWIESGRPSEKGPTLNMSQVIGHCELGISSDVIEHIREPDSFLEFLKSLKCRHYIISTPKREVLSDVNPNGPPSNDHHVREWAFHEMIVYLTSRGFDVIQSYDGVQHSSTQVHVLRVSEKP